MSRAGDLCGCPVADGATHYWHPTACPAEAVVTDRVRELEDEA